jgi:hypothetical protein
MTIKKQNPLVGKFYIQRPGYVQYIDSEVSPGHFLVKTLSVRRVETNTLSTGTVRATRDLIGLQLFDTFEDATTPPEVEHADTQAIREYRSDDKIAAKFDKGSR